MGISSPNWIDAVLVLAICTGIVLGLGQGLLRQVMTMVALYVSTVLAYQYYRVAAIALGDLIPQAVPAARNGVGIAAIFAASFLVLNFLSYGIYPSTRIFSLQWLDQFGGAVLGLIWVGCAAGISLSVANYAMSGLFSPWEPPRQAFESLLSHSQLSTPILSALPLMYKVVSPWLPYGLPAPFVV